MELLTQTQLKTFLITMILVMIMVILPKLGLQFSDPSILSTLNNIKIQIPQLIINL